MLNAKMSASTSLLYLLLFILLEDFIMFDVFDLEVSEDVACGYGINNPNNFLKLSVNPECDDKHNPYYSYRGKDPRIIVVCNIVKKINSGALDFTKDERLATIKAHIDELYESIRVTDLETAINRAVSKYRKSGSHLLVCKNTTGILKPKTPYTVEYSTHEYDHCDYDVSPGEHAVFETGDTCMFAYDDDYLFRNSRYLHGYRVVDFCIRKKVVIEDINRLIIEYNKLYRRITVDYISKCSKLYISDDDIFDFLRWDKRQLRYTDLFKPGDFFLMKHHGGFWGWF